MATIKVLQVKCPICEDKGWRMGFEGETELCMACIRERFKLVFGDGRREIVGVSVEEVGNGKES